MFTGLIEEIGVLRRRSRRGPGARALVQTVLGPLVLGESIAVSGACLTVDAIVAGGFEADMSAETLERSTLGEVVEGSRVHLERAVPLGGRMGGHSVLGHVDGVGRIRSASRVGDAIRIELGAPGELARFVAEKGSIAIDGVSLTVNAVSTAVSAVSDAVSAVGTKAASNGSELVFDVMIVPHTRKHTYVADLRAGARVNLEVDVLARYILRALDVGGSAKAESAGHVGRDADQRLLESLRRGGYT